MDVSTANVVLQFFLVTVTGGFLTWYIGTRRDRRERRDAKEVVIRALVAEASDLYRRSKQIKRSLRSRLDPVSNGTRRIAARFFEEQMDELSKVQLGLEQFSLTVRMRHDLFDEERRSRLKEEISYAEKYFSCVVEEFHDRHAVLADGAYVLDWKACPHLGNYLEHDSLPPELEAAKEKIGDGRPLERFRNLSAFSAEAKFYRGSRPGALKRYRQVADSCLILALLEMREATDQTRKPGGEMSVDAPEVLSEDDAAQEAGAPR